MPLKIYKEPEKPQGGLSRVRFVLGIAAGKGGVGKSTVTANLARALRQRGSSVGVLDTDVYGPSIRKMLPEDRLPGRKGDKLVPALCEGISVISLAYFRKEHEAAAVRAPIANGVINQFLHGVEWGELDYLLIDFPPGTGDIQLTLSQQAHLTGAIMVTTPQEVAVMDVKKAMSLFDAVQVPVVGIVENMSYYTDSNREKVYLFGKGGGEKLALGSGLPFLGQIPLDAALCESGDTGRSLFGSEGEASPAAEAIKLISLKIVAHVEALKKQEGERLQKFELAWKEMG